MTIYLDYAATTPVDPRVAAVMAEVLTRPDAQANPASSTHGPGLDAHARVEAARARVAALVGGEAREIIFTSQCARMMPSPACELTGKSTWPSS